MKRYRIIYEVATWVQQPVSVVANDELDALEKGKQRLIEAGYQKHEFVSLTNVAKDMKKEEEYAVSK